ncbi:restriction endonuclease [Wohlfahrtiimonas larvae]|uniref:Restriction endonuclease type IV Mrr domain-containing protein n=1 Tax=Wohlfahrtiimonas larvae TaxID=1157986 RepID=A0ABP9MQT7_9GAMM|nr:restriction endonuclease [Wohlfahrtiimonas larvae]
MLSIFKKKTKEQNVEVVEAVNTVNLAELLTFDQEGNEVLSLIKTLNDTSENTAKAKKDKSTALNEIAKLILEKMGYYAEITDGMNDGGIDVIGYKGNVREIGVQCKAWNPKGCNSRINNKDVNAFKGSLSSKNCQMGLFITTHYFDDFALKEANENLILIDRKYLLEILTNYFPNAVSNYLYHQDLGTQDACPNCSNGKIIKIYRDAKPSFDWCESCREVPRYKA